MPDGQFCRADRLLDVLAARLGQRPFECATGAVAEELAERDTQFTAAGIAPRDRPVVLGVGIADLLFLILDRGIAATAWVMTAQSSANWAASRIPATSTRRL